MVVATVLILRKVKMDKTLFSKKPQKYSPVNQTTNRVSDTGFGTIWLLMI